MLAVAKTMGPATWAEKTAATIGRRLTSDNSHLDGWTEFRIANEIELVHFVAVVNEAAEHKIVWKTPVPYMKEYHLKQLKFDLQ